MKLSEVKKAVVAAVGVVAMAVSSGFVHGEALTIAEAVLALATTAGVYSTKNAPSSTVATLTADAEKFAAAVAAHLPKHAVIKTTIPAAAIVTMSPPSSPNSVGAVDPGTSAPVVPPAAPPA